MKTISAPDPEYRYQRASRLTLWGWLPTSWYRYKVNLPHPRWTWAWVLVLAVLIGAYVGSVG